MNLELLTWPLAIACLWTPAAVMFSAKIRGKLRNPVRRRDEGIGSLLRCHLNWIDLGRGALGACLVQHEVHNYLSGQDDIATVYTVVEYTALSLAVLLQILWIDRPVRIIGPAFFLTGLTFIVCGPTIGGFALLLGFTCALMLRRLSLAFVFVPCSLVGFAAFFQAFSALILLNSVLFALPIIMAFAFGSRLAFVRSPLDAPVRRRKPKGNQGDAAVSEPARKAAPPKRIKTSSDKAAAFVSAGRPAKSDSTDGLDLPLPRSLERQVSS